MRAYGPEVEQRVMAALGLDPADLYERIVVDIRPEYIPRVIVQRPVLDVPDTDDLFAALALIAAAARPAGEAEP